MPQEIKDSIWELALGGNTIYTEYDPEKEEISCVTVPLSKEMGVVEGLANPPGKRKMIHPSMLVTCGQANCVDDVNLVLYDRSNLNLSLLSTCKAINAEANTTPYSKNCFIFTSPYTMSKWIEAFTTLDANSTTKRLAAIRRIAIEQFCDNLNFYKTSRFAQTFLGLKHLSVIILEGFFGNKSVEERIEISEELCLKYLLARDTSFELRYLDDGGITQTKSCVVET